MMLRHPFAPRWHPWINTPVLTAPDRTVAGNTAEKAITRNSRSGRLWCWTLWGQGSLLSVVRSKIHVTQQKDILPQHAGNVRLLMCTSKPRMPVAVQWQRFQARDCSSSTKCIRSGECILTTTGLRRLHSHAAGEAVYSSCAATAVKRARAGSQP